MLRLLSVVLRTGRLRRSLICACLRFGTRPMTGSMFVVSRLLVVVCFTVAMAVVLALK